MLIDRKVFEDFREIKIGFYELMNQTKNQPHNSKTVDGKDVFVSRQNVIHAINKFVTTEISFEEFMHWVNTILFNDVFTFDEIEGECIVSVLDRLEEIDEPDKRLKDGEIEKMMDALENNIEYYTK